jgi:DNA-binding FadR family transcriptional regulator
VTTSRGFPKPPTGIRPLKRASLHEQITTKLGVAILSGELKEGEISSETALRRKLGVSRTILRESLKVLVSKGLLTLRPKVGVSIRPRCEWNLFDPDVLAWQAETVVDNEFIRTLCEVRLIVETAGAALAAVRGTSEEKAAISSCFTVMESNLSTKEAYDEADIAFHGAIFDACHNDLLRQLGKTIRSALRLQDRSGSEAGIDESLALHQEVASAILKGDEAAARTAMENIILHAARVIYHVTDTLKAPQRLDATALATARSMLKQVLEVLGRQPEQSAGTDLRASQAAPASVEQGLSKPAAHSASR